MSYLGFVKTLCKGFLAGYQEPKVLEIGVHRGQTALPLIHNLSLFKGFTYIGVDIIPCELVVEQLSQYAHVSLLGLDMERTGRDAILQFANSLEWLELNQQRKTKFDMVLVDGDHNYKTVSKELELIQAVIHPMSIIVCDDYHGQWAETDLYYSDRDEYKDNEKATKREESEKQGVKTAVDDWLKKNDSWNAIGLQGQDPIFLYRDDVWEEFKFTIHPNTRGKTVISRDVELTARLRSNHGGKKQETL